MALANEREVVSPIVGTNSIDRVGPIGAFSPPTRELAYSSFSWKAVFAGVFVSMMVYLILTSLGLAIGASALTGIIKQSGNAQGLGIGSGIWLIITTIISLFSGSYVAGRVGGFIPVRFGRAQGMVIASLFFLFMISQVGGLMGSLGGGLSHTFGSLGGMVGDLAKNPRVQDTIDTALADLDLRSPPDVVIQGVAVRLLRGDSTSARDYLAKEARISRGEADARLSDALTKVQGIANDVATTATKAISIAGWTMFGTFLLGLLAAISGGTLGVTRNLTTPVSKYDRSAVEKSKAA